MLGDPVVDVEGFSQLVDVAGFSSYEIDDSSAVGPAS
jgi:hypothetical protein